MSLKTSGLAYKINLLEGSLHKIRHILESQAVKNSLEGQCFSLASH